MKHRNGFGIVLALVTILMVCLAVAGAAQLFYSGEVYGQAARGAGGMVAEYLAESAVDDVVAQLNADLNDPSRAVFGEVRKALLGRVPAKLDLSRRYRVQHLTETIEASEDAAFFRMFDVDDPKMQLRVTPRNEGGEQQLL